MTDNETYILEALRSLKPFEVIEITADKLGKPDSFIVKRSFKVLLSIDKPINLK